MGIIPVETDVVLFATSREHLKHRRVSKHIDKNVKSLICAVIRSPVGYLYFVSEKIIGNPPRSFGALLSRRKTVSICNAHLTWMQLKCDVCLNLTRDGKKQIFLNEP